MARGGSKILESILATILLGSLGAVLLPRVVSLTTDAHDRAFGTIQHNFRSAVNHVHFKWLSQGGGNVVRVQGEKVHVNDKGWPTLGDDWRQDSSDELWAKLMRNDLPSGWSLDGYREPGAGTIYFHYGTNPDGRLGSFVYDAADGSVTEL